MIWHIQYSPLAEADIEDIYDYIAAVLLAPEAAADQTLRIIKAINSLSKMPMRYRLYDHEPWDKLGVRIMPVDRYVVLYLAEGRNAIVRVLRILYGARDLPSQLNELCFLMEEG